MNRLLSAALGVCVVGVVGGAAHATSVTTVRFDDFSDANLARLQLNGSTASIHSGGAVSHDGQDVLRLTNQLNQTGSAFLSDPVVLWGDASFSAFFSFQFTDPTGISDGDGQGADGIVFTLHTDDGSTGGIGAGIGYAGITPSVGIEFDTYNNGGYDGNNGNHVGINLNGSLNSAARANVDERMNNGDVWYAWVDYDGASDALEVRLSQVDTRPLDALVSYSVDLATQLGVAAGGTDAYIGFTSGTGAASNDHDVRSWGFTNTYDPTFAAVPLPTSAWAGLALFSALGGARLVRRRA